MTVQSGDIRAKDTRLHQLEARCNSGSILLDQVHLKADAQLHANSGSITLTDVQGGTLSADAGSGDVRLTNVLTEDSLRLETNSGNIKLQHSDGAAITIRSGSGDVSGSLRTPKQFVTQTGSGSCSVPESGTGGACEIRTNRYSIKGGRIGKRQGNPLPLLQIICDCACSGESGASFFLHTCMRPYKFPWNALYD